MKTVPVKVVRSGQDGWPMTDKVTDNVDLSGLISSWGTEPLIPLMVPLKHATAGAVVEHR